MELIHSDSRDRQASVDDLMQIIQTYNGLTDRLQRTHETLTAEVQRLQRELASANAALVRSRRLAALGEMAAGIAHEVRNPLASIQLYAGMLREDLADRPGPRQVAERIAEATRGLNAVVNDVLTFARETRLNVRNAPLLGTVYAAMEAVRPMMDAAEIGLVFDWSDEAIQVPHDPDLLRQALVNLLRNAIEAMEGRGTLTIRQRSTGGEVRLGIRDTGPGIDEQQIDRIFNPFFTTRATGTGLGLAIVHRIIDAHGGSIAVTNEGGAVFTLTLPLQLTHSQGGDA